MYATIEKLDEKTRVTLYKCLEIIDTSANAFDEVTDILNYAEYEADEKVIERAMPHIMSLTIDTAYSLICEISSILE